MKLRDPARLRHILDAARQASSFSSGRKRKDLDHDPMFALAVVRLIEIMGEAAKALSPELRRRYPEIPWAEIAGTRDRLVHGYMDVDNDVVWEILTEDIPAMLPTLEKVVSTECAGK